MEYVETSFISRAFFVNGLCIVENTVHSLFLGMQSSIQICYSKFVHYVVQISYILAFLGSIWSVRVWQIRTMILEFSVLVCISIKFLPLYILSFIWVHSSSKFSISLLQLSIYWYVKCLCSLDSLLSDLISLSLLFC